jgi:hypothetical protein
MANNKIDMLQIKQLLRLYTEGVSKLKISRRLNLSRSTIRKYIGLFHTHQLTYEDLSGLSAEEVENLFDTRELSPDSKENMVYLFLTFASFIFKIILFMFCSIFHVLK